MNPAPIAESSLFLVFAALVGAGMGLPISEDAVLLFTGALAERGVFLIPAALATCFAGVLAGDFIIFSIGRKLGPRLFERRFIQKVVSAERRKLAETLIQNRGSYAIFIARFLIGFRLPTFATAGVLGMSPARFLFFDALALCISAPMMFSLGYFFSDRIDEIQEHLGTAQLYVIGALVAVGFLAFLFYRRRTRR